MSHPVQLVLPGVDGSVRITPPLFFNTRTGLDPADLTKFTPHGNGVYGYQEGLGDPIKSAPPQDDVGGYLHFGADMTRQDFDALMHIMGVRERWWQKDPRDYVVFYGESNQPGSDGYLSQIRIVSRRALSSMFGSITEAEYNQFPGQEVSMADALWGFMQNERINRNGASLNGLFGGDGDFAVEQLCFGFAVENNYFGVYRMWSRAWLITK